MADQKIDGALFKSMVIEGALAIAENKERANELNVFPVPDGGVDIDLHIAVEHGVNIATVCRSIIGEVRYHVERLTGVDVKNVDVYVESIRAD